MFGLKAALLPEITGQFEHEHEHGFRGFVTGS